MKNTIWHKMSDRPTVDAEEVVVINKNKTIFTWVYIKEDDAFYDPNEECYTLNEQNADKWAYLIDLANATGGFDG